MDSKALPEELIIIDNYWLRAPAEILVFIGPFMQAPKAFWDFGTIDVYVIEGRFMCSKFLPRCFSFPICFYPVCFLFICLGFISHLLSIIFILKILNKQWG